jgi:Lrp/AsnC family transcriptional regulator, leucine-responsive regulatory protein
MQNPTLVLPTAAESGSKTAMTDRKNIKSASASEATRRGVALDDLDRAILDELTHDPFVSTRALADALHVATSLVISRLRVLDRRNASHVIAVLDMKRLGQSFCFVHIDLAIESEGLVEKIAAMREVLMISELIGGRADLLVLVRFTTFTQLNDLLYGRLARLGGIRRWRIDVVLDVPAFRSEYVTLTPSFLESDFERNIEDLRLELPEGLCDELDLKLIAHLQQNARQSLNEMSRKLDVNASTLRYRVKALESSGILRFITVIDRQAAGIDAFALVELEVEVQYVDRVVEALRNHPSLPQLFVCAGASSMLGVMLARDDADVLRIKQTELATVPGVVGVTTTRLHRTHKIDFRWGQEVH